MPGCKNGSINLFISVALTLIVLLMVSLPVIAAAPLRKDRSISITSTPGKNIYITPNNILADLSEPTQTPEFIGFTSPTPTALLTSSYIPADGLTSTPTDLSAITSTSAILLEPTETSTVQPTTGSFFPFIPNEEFIPTTTPSPPERVLFCDTLNQPLFIPDNNTGGIDDDITISDNRVLVNLSLYLNITHTWVGDLVVTLTKQNSGDTITVLDQPGAPPGACYNDHVMTILDDAAAQEANAQCAVYPVAISGIYLPSEAFSVFTGSNMSGQWILNVSDQSPSDTGSLNRWCLDAKLSEILPPPTPTPTPAELPSIAYVSGMSGQNQQLPLDCESRSAVDWANHFGFNIDEFDFLGNLPSSDDPEVGFVGNPNGIWGRIPPDDYGVHAPPVASVLRDYGLNASSFHSSQWIDLKAEIASGNPVIVWIIGGGSYNLVNGIPQYYLASSTGDTTIVAKYEHTVILIGYEPGSVTVLNGSRIMKISMDQFLDSWSVLNFMAVLARP